MTCSLLVQYIIPFLFFFLSFFSNYFQFFQIHKITKIVLRKLRNYTQIASYHFQVSCVHIKITITLNTGLNYASPIKWLIICKCKRVRKNSHNEVLSPSFINIAILKKKQYVIWDTQLKYQICSRWAFSFLYIWCTQKQVKHKFRQDSF